MARRILLADDSVTAQNMGRRILTDAGYEVITVNNGSAALKKIQEQKPDLIVLDVYMPGYGGLEVCQRVKETTRIPVLLTVGKLEPFKPDEARRVRADAFIVKPFEASELLSALTKLEDKIVPQPQPQKVGRFAKTLAAIEQAEKFDSGEQFGDKETGWKNRLIIPSGAPKSKESEAQEVREPEAPTVSARVEEKPKEQQPPTVEPAEVVERSVPAGLPSDITADEIAAISAAAATISANVSPEATASAQVEAVAVAADTVDSAPSVTESEIPAPPAMEAHGTIAEQAVATVLAQAAAEASQAKSEAAAPPANDADVMAAIASLAPSAEPESSPPVEASAVPPVTDSSTVAFSGPRWVARPLELLGEEASLDLHAEMSAAQQTAPETSAAPVEVVATVAAVAAVEPIADTQPAAVAEATPAAALETPIKEEAFAAAAGVGTQEVASSTSNSVVISEPASVETSPDAPPKDAELAAAWQNWKQIRDSIVSSNLTEQIAHVAAAEIKAEAETTQQAAGPLTEEAGEEESSEPAAIASIVDSVLAELKPKLVEEIARKMKAEKKASSKK